jgi:hypothetical protein
MTPQCDGNPLAIGKPTVHDQTTNRGMRRALLADTNAVMGERGKGFLILSAPAGPRLPRSDRHLCAKRASVNILVERVICFCQPL